MLTRLELIGFKSFADRTRFDFAPGITAVVGPNGSGKSNVVDAVRWILGEQSAKSLRGAEMTDVIFNGSASRKSLGMAEVTLSFDNSQRDLDVDADDVTITRRVYRDGQGEYLLNGREARLKEIKELFLGSGAGHGAYSVIEQGRVDALLTASTKDRRIIFEEAAGISRFKLKKAETLKKLERVDGDLVRVHDVLRELEAQLSTLRLSAAKAQKHRDYQVELKRIRVAGGIRDYRRFSGLASAQEAERASLATALDVSAGESPAVEIELNRRQLELGRTDDAAKLFERRRGELRERLASLDSSGRAEFASLTELEEERPQAGRRRFLTEVKLSEVSVEVDRLGVEVASARNRLDAETGRAHEIEQLSIAATDALERVSRRLDAERGLLFHAVSDDAKRLAAKQNATAQRERLHQEQLRKHRERDILRQRLEGHAVWLQELGGSDADLRSKLTALQFGLRRQQTQRDQLNIEADQLQPRLDDLRRRRAHLAGRAEVLNGLERSLNGFTAGVQTVLHRRTAGDAVLRESLHGLVADLVRAPRGIAALVDLALGDAAQCWVAVGRAELDATLNHLDAMPGRVGFVCVDPQTPSTPQFAFSEPPPIPLAMLVESDVPGLAERLLGRFFLVPDSARAATLVRRHPGLHALTSDGERWSADGTVSIGPPQSEVGIVSRKSELRDVRAQLIALEGSLSDGEARQAKLRREAEALVEPIREAEAAVAALTGEAGTLRERMQERQRTQERDSETLAMLEQDIMFAGGELDKAADAVRRTEADHAQAAAAVQGLEVRIGSFTAEVAAADQQRTERMAERAAIREALVRLQEQHESLRRNRDERTATLHVLRQEREQLRRADAALAEKAKRLTSAILSGSSMLRELHAALQTVDAGLRDLQHRRRTILEARVRCETLLQSTHHRSEADRRALHRCELALQDACRERDLVFRTLTEEYAVDPDAFVGEPDAVPPEAAGRIEELRKLTTKLGAVNLESLEQLAVVEARERDLRTQFDDLNQGRDALKRIIDQINADSRKLFAETLTVIRGHFQELFRKLFGGGQADIVLETPDDPLESGIEITAHPPGKQAQRISLLSGGERALTAVALLLAIFRSRPSPFCLLDEIDAAMDEANTQRLAELLAEFSDRSQFIVITHKKRTMAKADVLHGVTMQESGVSRLIAVRFEDWPDDAPTAAAA